MSAINGILYFNSYCLNEPVSFFKNNIHKMNQETAHRGPDGEGTLIKYPIIFGHRRLCIIDLSENAAQPMFNEDNTVAIIFNGEVYNYKELIPDLKCKGHVFKSRSDTEVIIHSYEEYGFDCVNRFNGIWAFAIYDFKKNIFFASRDRFGLKPFYYFADDSQFIFSSEIKAILKIKGIREANHGKVFDYLAYGYITNNGDTFFRDIKELKGAYNLIVQKNKIEIKKYWDFNKENISENGIHDRIKFLLDDSIKLRFRSDVPVSIIISGGIDSSILAKQTDLMIRSGQLNVDSALTFFVDFPGFIMDESQIMKNFLPSCMHLKPLKISPYNNNLLDSINDFVYGMGEPVLTSYAFSQYFVMKEIHKHDVKVVINGEGADEAWCGNGEYFIGYFLLDLLISEPDKFLSQMNSISDKMNFSNKYILMQMFKAVLPRRYSSYLRAKYRENIINCLQPDYFKSNYNYFTNPDYKKLSSDNLSGYMKYNIQQQGLSQTLHYEDHCSMQSSIELRSPFLDYRLMEFAFSLPAAIKLSDGITKKILREIFKNKLPGYIINSHYNTSFKKPFKNWIDEKETKSFINDLIGSESFKSKKIFDAGKIKNVFNNNNNHKRFPLWRVMNLELWSRAYNINNL